MINPADILLLFGDLQERTTGRALTVPGDAIKANVAKLRAVADVLGIPVIHSMIPHAGDPIPGTAEGAEVLPRSTTDAFLDATTRDRIAATGRRTIALAGVASEVVVLHTALSALAAGHAVHVVVDACGGLSERSERAAFDRMGRAGAAMTSVMSFATELLERTDQGHGPAVVKLLFGGR